jgi:hypothetical protein
MDAREPDSPSSGKAPAADSTQSFVPSFGSITGSAKSGRIARFQYFWSLLSKCESLTALEAGCFKAGRYEEIERLQQEKAAVFASLQVVGRGLGIDRSNRDLRLRLEALAEAENRNLTQFSAALDSLRVEMRDSGVVQRSLHSLRGAYSPEDARGDFFMEG